MGCLAMEQPVAPGLDLLDRVEVYLRHHRMPPTRFGKLAVGSPSLVNRMRQGKVLRPDTVRRVEAQLDCSSPDRGFGKFKFTSIGKFKAARYAKVVHERDVAERQERQHRLTDPVEQAATFLRQKGWMVARARVFDENATGWAVGRLRLGDEGLLERARSKGWRG